MKKQLLIIVSLLAYTAILSAQAPTPVISFTFDTDTEEGGTITDVVSGITGELKGSAYCLNGDLILEQAVDTAMDFLELDAESVEINTFSEFSVLISFTSDTLDLGGVTNTYYGIWAFGNTDNDVLGADYIHFTPSREGRSRAQAVMSCGIYDYQAYEYEDTTLSYVPNLMDDEEHMAIITVDDVEFGFFVDGTEVGYTELGTDNENNSISNLSNAYARIGATTYLPQYVSPFKGAIHEFKVYDKALTAEDVEAILSSSRTHPMDKAIPTIYSTGESVVVSLENTGNVHSTIQIYNVAGRLIHKQECTNSREEISLSTGIYMVRVDYGSATHSEKIIINR